MAISNYGELKSELSGYMFNTRLATSYDNATLLFEAVVNRGIPATSAGGRYICFPRQMEAVTNLTTSSGSAALPSDYAAWRAVLYTVTTPYKELDYVHPAYLHSTWVENDSGDPKIFTIEGSTFYARPVKDTASAYEFHYYQKLTTITGNDSNTNWMLTNYPDAYLEGVLTELFAKARNREAAELHKARRDEIFADIAMSSARTTGATSSIVRQEVYF